MADAHHPRKISRGSEALGKRLAAPGAKAQLARDMQRRPELISRWVSGWRVPLPRDRAELQRRFDISWLAWDEPVSGDVHVP